MRHGGMTSHGAERSRYRTNAPFFQKGGSRVVTTRGKPGMARAPHWPLLLVQRFGRAEEFVTAALIGQAEG